MSNLRSFLLIALGMVGFLLWQAWQQDYAQRALPAASDTPGVKPTPGVTPALAADIPAPRSDAATPAVPAADPVAGPALGAAASSHAPRVTVTTDVLRVVIDTAGGNIVQADLLGYPQDPKRRDSPVRLLHEESDALFVAQSGLVSSSNTAPDHRARLAVAADSYRLAPGNDALEVPLTWTDGGVTVTKRFRFERGSYLIGVAHEVRNESATPWIGSVYRQLQRTPPVKAKGYSFTNPEQYSFVGATWWSPTEHFEKLKFDDFADPDSTLSREISGGWAAMVQHYFFAAWIPPAAEKDQYSTQRVGEGAPHYLIRQLAPPITVAPGASATLEAHLYLGPKQQGKLDAIAPGLDATIDYGKVTVIAKPLFALLSLLHRLLGNWGWSIVFITVLVKLALYPLSEAQYRSMAKMRKMQPRLAALKERYGDDKQKYNQAMMELYQKEKINPMGGCLPIVVQIPVFIALYWVLLESVELRQAPFILWIDNLSARDPYFVLPVLNGLAMFLGQKLSPNAGMDPMQQKMMQMMPIVFSVMFAFFPAGLVLYWTVNGILSLAQQFVITRRIEAQGSKALAGKA